MNKYNLFLDDVRIPENCASYAFLYGIRGDIYIDEKWIIVRSYDEFTKYISKNGLPQLISFDHDLGDEHYSMLDKTDCSDWNDYYETHDREMTGYDCAKWLIEYCLDNGEELPQYVVHSMNSIGRKNIKDLLDSF